MPGLLRGVARTAVISGTATAVSNRVSRRQAGRWAQQDEERAAAPPRQSYAAPPQQPYGAPAPPAEGASMDARISQLQQLGQLKAQGVLTEGEFEEQKRRILGT